MLRTLWQHLRVSRRWPQGSDARAAPGPQGTHRHTPWSLWQGATQSVLEQLQPRVMQTLIEAARDDLEQLPHVLDSGMNANIFSPAEWGTLLCESWAALRDPPSAWLAARSRPSAWSPGRHLAQIPGTEPVVEALCAQARLLCFDDPVVQYWATTLTQTWTPERLAVSQGRGYHPGVDRRLVGQARVLLAVPDLPPSLLDRLLLRPVLCEEVLDTVWAQVLQHPMATAEHWRTLALGTCFGPPHTSEAQAFHDLALPLDAHVLHLIENPADLDHTDWLLALLPASGWARLQRPTLARALAHPERMVRLRALAGLAGSASCHAPDPGAQALGTSRPPEEKP